jgi:hypothetical protein
MWIVIIILIAVIIKQFFSNIGLYRESCLQYGKTLRLQKELDGKNSELSKAKERIQYLSKFIPEDELYDK